MINKKLAFVIILGIIGLLVLLGILGVFSNDKNNNDKNNKLIDMSDYGSDKNLSETLKIFTENYNRENYEKVGITNPFQEIGEVGITNPFQEIATNENTQIMIDSIKKLTGEEPYLCLNKKNINLENSGGMYRPTVYINLNMAIIKSVMYLLQKNPPQIYDAASIMLPYVKLLNSLEFPNFFRNIEIIYENDNTTVKYIRAMKMNLKKNPDNTQTQLDSNEPMSLYEFVAHAFLSEGLNDGKLIYEKSSYAHLVEEIIINPFIELCKKTYGEIPNLNNKIEATEENTKIDLLTFTKCVFMRSLRKFNFFYILYNCCDSEDKSTCEKDALKNV